MAEGISIVIEINNSDPLDLADFISALSGLSREHENILRESRPSISAEETRLLVADVRKGSIIMELVPALAPLVSTAEFVNTTVDFVAKLKKGFDQLKQVGGRLADPSVQRLKNFNDTVKAIAADPSGRLVVKASHKEKGILQEFSVGKDDARLIIENTNNQKSELELHASAPYSKVLMRLHQSSVETPKIGKRNAEKGIVERIDASPRPLVYASDQAGQAIKSEILNPDGNAFNKGFIVDLDVETVGGRPKVYRITAVYNIIDLDDE
jgi:hypothetical protein